jgi:hypothetical protein
MPLGRGYGWVSRPLEANEHDVLLKVLDARTFEGSAELRAQVSAAVVVSGPPTFLKFDVDSEAPTARCSDGPIPVRAFVRRGGEIVGELLVWVKSGRLAALEFAWVTDEEPTSLPTPDAVQFDAG